MVEELTAQQALQSALKLGLTDNEYHRIEKILGRVPNFTELSVYAVMWSEHCSYKNSILYLKKLPREGSQLLVEAGEENAGLVDIGDGLACAFKIESHNHPSAIEPYQGAATGVGGIHRDIFTMGARPIAALNSLRFGNIHRSHTQHLLKGVVKGIGDYGNCLGVPTIGGETYFMDCYNQNILVNAMSIGIVEQGKTVSATSHGVGNPVFIVGSATGKDGIHGATFASADLTEDSAQDLPAVQVGDPFQEKLLLEASLEVIESGALVGMQDMGAAGITCSTSEMSAKGESGMIINLDKVPTRQSNMQPFEILLSESQERMLIVGIAGEEEKLQAIFEKWDLECEQIGEVTDDGRLKYYHHGELVADVPAESLVLGGGAPVYQRDYREPAYMEKIKSFEISDITVPEDLKQVAEQIAIHPNIVSKRWIFEQYDSMVRTNSMNTNDPCDAAVIRIKENGKALAASVDCNSSYVYADPYVGGLIAVSESARNLVCSGAKPLAITNCLNFGNPYDQEVYYQFVHALRGMGDACRKFNTPVTGGNVSFYNQTVLKDKTIPVYPTPTIGMLGLLDDPDLRTSIPFKQTGHVIALVGKEVEDLGSSIYLRDICGVSHSPAPYFDLEEEFKLHQAISQMIRSGLVASAHDVSEGGLFVSLLESSMLSNLGFTVNLRDDIRRDAVLFGESQGRVVVSFESKHLDNLRSICQNIQVDFNVLGTVGGNEAVIDGEHFGLLSDYKHNYNQYIHQIVEDKN